MLHLKAINACKCKYVRFMTHYVIKYISGNYRIVKQSVQNNCFAKMFSFLPVPTCIFIACPWLPITVSFVAMPYNWRVAVFRDILYRVFRDTLYKCDITGIWPGCRRGCVWLPGGVILVSHWRHGHHIHHPGASSPRDDNMQCLVSRAYNICPKRNSLADIYVRAAVPRSEVCK